MNRKLLLLLIFLFLLPASFIFCQEGNDEEDFFEEVYGLGDQTFTITAGLFHPLFYSTPDFEFVDDNLTMGGCGSLQWNAYINSNWSLGGEFGGMFAFTPNDRILYMMPLTFKVTRYFRKYPFEFPVFMAGGFSFNSVADAFHLDLILKPGAGVYWNFNPEWAFGFNAVYWWVPQIYTGNGLVPASNTRFGHFLETSLSALFRF